MYYAYARVKFPVSDIHGYVSPVMLLFLRETGIHHLWLSNLTTAWDVTTTTRSTQHCIPLGSVHRVTALAGGKGGKITAARVAGNTDFPQR